MGSLGQEDWTLGLLQAIARVRVEACRPPSALYGWEAHMDLHPAPVTLDLHPTPVTSQPYHRIGRPTLHYTAGPSRFGMLSVTLVLHQIVTLYPWGCMYGECCSNLGMCGVLLGSRVQASCVESRLTHGWNSSGDTNGPRMRG